MSFLDWVGLALLGGTGALLRYAVDAWFVRRLRTTFPIATLVINTSGSFALGVLTGADVTGSAIFLAGTGLIGSFTTFSTWIFETQRLAEKNETPAAVWNIAVTLAAGLAAAGAGWAIAALV
jgi:fluoride exporter